MNAETVVTAETKEVFFQTLLRFCPDVGYIRSRLDTDIAQFFLNLIITRKFVYFNPVKMKRNESFIYPFSSFDGQSTSCI